MRIPIGAWVGNNLSAEYALIIDVSRLGKIVGELSGIEFTGCPMEQEAELISDANAPRP